jgi:multidrug efflux pump subunit AcrA (membrane-fusion protein)
MPIDGRRRKLPVVPILGIAAVIGAAGLGGKALLSIHWPHRAPPKPAFTATVVDLGQPLISPVAGTVVTVAAPGAALDAGATLAEIARPAGSDASDIARLSKTLKKAEAALQQALMQENIAEQGMRSHRMSPLEADQYAAITADCQKARDEAAAKLAEAKARVPDHQVLVAQTALRVREVHAAEGAAVHAGDVLLVMEPRDSQATVTAPLPAGELEVVIGDRKFPAQVIDATTVAFEADPPPAPGASVTVRSR